MKFTKSDWDLILAISTEKEIQNVWKKALNLPYDEEGEFFIKAHTDRNILEISFDSTDKIIEYNLNDAVDIAKEFIKQNKNSFH